MAIACVACVNFTEGAHRLLGHVRHSLVVIGEGDETIDQLQRVLLSLLPRLAVEQLRGGVDEPLTSKLFWKPTFSSSELAPFPFSGITIFGIILADWEWSYE